MMISMEENGFCFVIGIIHYMAILIKIKDDVVL